MRKFISIVLLLLILSLVTIMVGCSSNADKHDNADVEFQEQGRLQEVIAKFDEIILLDPQNADAYYYRGNAYCDLGQHEQAIEDYCEAIRLNPQHASAYCGRALVYTLVGMDTEAEQDFNRAVELGTDHDILKSEIERLKRLR